MTLYGRFSTFFQRDRVRANPEKNQKLRIMMPTRWPSYLLVILSALFGLILPLILPQLWRVKRGKSFVVGSTGPSEGEPIAIRFHLAALLFIGFLATTLLWIPLLGGVRRANGLVAAGVIIATTLPMVIALFYCLRKGDLSWSAPRSRDEKGSL